MILILVVGGLWLAALTFACLRLASAQRELLETHLRRFADHAIRINDLETRRSCSRVPIRERRIFPLEEKDINV